MKFLLIMFILTFSMNAFSSTQEERIFSEIDYLSQTSHTDLDLPHLSFSLYKIFDPKTYFVSNFKLKRIFLGHHKYRLGYNPLIFKEDISEGALRGVLAHELSHTEDYVRGSTIGTILPIGVKVTFKKSRIQYERKTDLKVIHKGLAKELIQFKEFQYGLLSHEQIEEKKTTYLSPKEVLYAENLMQQNPAYFTDWMNHKIPQSLSQFKVYDWFQNSNLKRNLERNSLDSSEIYSLTFSKSRKILTIIPVNYKGIISFNKSQIIDLSSENKIDFKNLSSTISGFLIFDEDLDFLRFESINKT